MSLGCSYDFITCLLAVHSMLIYLYFILECIAPARLTRVIAQASLGSPAGLCGFACWVGGWEILLETSLSDGKFSLHRVGDLYFNLDIAVVFDVVCEHFGCNFLATFDSSTSGVYISFGRSFIAFCDVSCIHFRFDHWLLKQLSVL